MSEPVPEAVPGEDLVIHAPCAVAEGAAPMNNEPEEAGDGVD